MTGTIGSRRLHAHPPLIELSCCSLILDGHKVLDDMSFTLHRGERWALIGPNGSGKTMLLKMLRGDMWPTPTGRERRSYCFDGEVTRDAVNSKAHVAYVGAERQDKYARYDWNLSVLQVVTTGLFDEDIPLSRPSRAQRERVARLLRRFGLWSLRKRRMLSLSYGQRRLTLVARAFASSARVLLLDEVFNGLDSRAKDKLRRALEQPRSKHDWVITSHRPHELPANVTHVAELSGGRIVAAGQARSVDLGPGGSAGKAAARKHSAASPTGAVAATRRAEQDSESRAPIPASSTPQPLIILRNADIYRDYRPVIRNLNWTLRRGEHWAVLGANGSGKSTLLSLLYGDLHPALGGSIERHGVPFGTRIEVWKRRVGWVSPELQADHYLAKSLEEIVISGRYASVGLNSSATPGEHRTALRWLRFFGIEHLRERGPRQVSYGQMRMALIARAMVNDPELLLLDEPCTGLDGDMRAQVLSVLNRLARNGTQLVMAVHDAADIVPAITKVLRIQRSGRVQL